MGFREFEIKVVYDMYKLRDGWNKGLRFYLYAYNDYKEPKKGEHYGNKKYK